LAINPRAIASPAANQNTEIILSGVTQILLPYLPNAETPLFDNVYISNNDRTNIFITGQNNTYLAENLTIVNSETWTRVSNVQIGGKMRFIANFDRSRVQLSEITADSTKLTLEDESGNIATFAS